MHIHILGVCGTFMGGIAQLAKAAGHRVSGCDSQVYPPMSTQLEAAGISLLDGYSADQIALNPDMYVIGNAISRGNPLLEEILDRNLPYVSGPQWLAEHVLRGRWVLAVAGTHGKTSTSAMLAWILEDAGLSPGFLIGGVPQNFALSARLSGADADSPFFVVEADEYDTAFCDKRSKFVHYRPRTTILNNLEFDHADIFPDLAAIQTQFHHLVRTMPRQGLLVVNAGEANLDAVLARGCWTPVERFQDPAAWHIEGDDRNGTLSLKKGSTTLAETSWQLNGAHNHANALAAILAARHIGVRAEQGLAALGKFEGVKRRLELRGAVGGVRLYDDFAHHPTAIATTLAGLRRKHNGARILAVLEPRSNTMKLGTMKAELANSLSAADEIFCYSENLTWDARESLAPLSNAGKKVVIKAQLTQLVAEIVASAQSGDQIVVMSNGGFGNIQQKLIDALNERLKT
ncbi:MAG: UDP-N-acetylmuramate:L-alanyl-gamma-D-glutamyl-meso-diaminopimelate ligase [Pseudomonadota bacterium]